MLFDTFYHSCKKAGKVIVAVILKIYIAPTTRICGKTILGKVYRRRVHESKEVGHTPLFRQTKKLKLS